MKQIQQIFPLVSIVVTTKNESKNILVCLESIQNQTYPRIEIIVIDNNSEDKTKEIAKKYTHKVYNYGNERSEQRNYGLLKKSKGDYLLYLDADMILQPDLLEECIKQIQETNSDALYIPEKILGKSYYSRVRNHERSFYSGTIIDGVRFFTKEAFINSGAFDTEITGQEDWSMDLQIKKNGGKISLLKNSWINHNEAEFNLKNYLNKKSYYSKTFDKYKEKWKGNEDVKKQLGFFYRYIGVFTENKKYRKLISHPILTMGMYYLRFRVGLRYLKRNG